jgi:predicted transcriptional regulator
VVKRNYIEDIEKVLSKKEKPVELLNVIFTFLNFKSVEIKIYNLLLKTSLTIKQIEQQLNISERTIRKHIKRLDEEGFIVKKVEQGKRLKYVYMAIPVQEAWEKVKDKIEKILSDITKVLETKTMLF